MTLDLEAIRARAETAQRWIEAAEGGPNGGWLPFSVREHFGTDTPKLLAEVEQLRALLAEFVDDEPCEFDHHGGCQTHGFLEPRPGQRCHVARARELLGGAL
jgi:hypothetical protein